MADVIHTPSLWDYLGQGANQGIENFTQARDKVKANQLAETGLAAQLFNSGAMDSSQFNTLAQSSGFKNLKVAPSKQERARKIIASPDLNPATQQPWSALDRADAGLPSQSAIAEDALATKKATIQQKYIDDPLSITDNEATAVGLPTQSALEAGRALESNKVLMAVGPKYIDTVLAPIAAQNGGLLPERFDVKPATEKAFALYSADRKANKLPVDPSVQAWFATQILDRMARDYQLRTGRVAANQVGIGARSAAADRQMQAYSGIISERQRMLSDLTTADKSLAPKLTMPEYAKDPNVVKYHALENSLHAAQNAQAHLAGATGAGLFVDDTGAAATPGAAGGTPAPTRPAVVSTAVSLLQTGRGTPTDMQAAIGQTMTQAEYDEAIKQYNALNSKKK